MLKRHASAALAAAALLCLSSCNPIPPTEPTPISIDITNNNTNNNGNPTTGASPLPGGGVIASVKTTQFGETCPQGTAPSGEDRSVRVGCTKHLTCTPFLSDGTPAGPAVHGPAPEFFGIISGGQFATASQQDEPFNLDAKGIAPGIASYRCTVKGVSSLTFDLTVVR